MPARSAIPIVRALFLVCCVLLGVVLSVASSGGSSGGMHKITGGVLGALFGGLIVGADILLKNLSFRSFGSGTFGLMTGVLCAWLLTRVPWAQSLFPPQWDNAEAFDRILNLIIYLTLGYLGIVLALRSNRQEFSLIIPYVRFRNEGVIQQPLLVDTNIIIDGRIPGICATGFLGGTLIIPRFVLDELHVLADANDPVKRDRGRRGLECLEQLKRTPTLSVTIHDDYQSQEKLVDTKLIQLGKSLDARLLTNDANLGRVALLQGLAVLNLNQLAHAMRPPLNVGDEVEIVLVKEGKDDHQAVGYLPDGTMIVVNHARGKLGSTAIATVSSSLQTSAGRLIFAELKSIKPPATDPPPPGTHPTRRK
ncbi:MAG: PIN domain-containing protein [Verrucomicrobiota bacterium]